MARLQLTFPEDQYCYTTLLTVRITRPKDKKSIAMAKQGFVFYNYKVSQVVAMPEEFKAKFERVNWVD